MPSDRFAVGDRIVITAKSHPHYGKAGDIEKASDLPAGHLAGPFDWIVSLDGAYEPSCYVTEQEIRRV